jgi:hypothetical protein
MFVDRSVEVGSRARRAFAVKEVDEQVAFVLRGL